MGKLTRRPAIINGLDRDMNTILADLATRPLGMRIVCAHPISTSYDWLTALGLAHSKQAFVNGAWTLEYQISDYGRMVLNAPRLM